MKHTDGKITVEHETTDGGAFSQKLWKEKLEAEHFKVAFEKINITQEDVREYIGILAIKKINENCTTPIRHGQR